MGKTRNLANTVSDGGPLADGVINIADVSGLQAALDAAGIKSGTAITTNGLAAYEFTGIPASAKNIKLLFSNVSASGLSTGAIQVQLGTSGGLATSGYTGNIHSLDSTTLSSSGTLTSSFLLVVTNSDAYQYSGIMEFSEVSSNVWVHQSQMYASTSRSNLATGRIDLGAELTTIRVFMGVGTFDGGTINILYS
jgi:hypothetical protein